MEQIRKWQKYGKILKNWYGQGQEMPNFCNLISHLCYFIFTQACANELKDHLQTTCDDIDLEIPMQVNEYTRKIWFKGVFLEELKDYIQKKGF